MSTLWQGDLEQLDDPYYRLNEFYKIKDKYKNIIQFQFNDFQERLWNEKTDKDIILKSRQVGVSTFWLLYYLDDCVFNDNTVTGILAHKKESLVKLFEIIKTAYETLPIFIKPTAKYDSKYELSFDNGSKIFVSLEIRSTTCNNLHISEAAFIPDASRIKASLETVPINGGRISIESTPNGMSGDFYERWKASKVGENDYKGHFFPWYEFKEYQLSTLERLINVSNEERKFKLSPPQIAFRRMKIKDLGDLFYQEYPEDPDTCFLTSEKSFFDLMRLREVYKGRKEIKEHEGELVIKSFDKTHIYGAGADVAEGLGGDYSVLTIVDLTASEAVYRLRGHWRPDIFAKKIYDACSQYRFPLLAVERNGMGLSTIIELENLGYPYLYKESKDKVGWTTNIKTKPIALNHLKKAVEDEIYFINDKLFLNECLTFVDKSGRIGSVTGKHDDIVMAYSIALMMCVEQTNQVNFSNIKELIKGVTLETQKQA